MRVERAGCIIVANTYNWLIDRTGPGPTVSFSHFTWTLDLLLRFPGVSLQAGWSQEPFDRPGPRNVSHELLFQNGHLICNMISTKLWSNKLRQHAVFCFNLRQTHDLFTISESVGVITKLLLCL